MSLVPEKEATPFASGPKILELGLTGFTGRLIISQQALQQYSLSISKNKSNNNDNKDAQSASTASLTGRTIQRQPQQQSDQQQQKTNQSTTTKEVPSTSKRQTQGDETENEDTSKRSKQRQTQRKATKTVSYQPQPPPCDLTATSRDRRNAGGGVPGSLDEMANVFTSTVATPTMTSKSVSVSIAQLGVDSVSTASSNHSNNNNSYHSGSTNDNVVEVVSVASSVSTREARRRDSKEDTLAQLATAFSTSGWALPHGGNTTKEHLDKIDENSRNSGFQSCESSQQSSQQQQSYSSNSQGEDSSERAEGDPLSEFATAFVALSGIPGRNHNIGSSGSIDGSSVGSASVAPSLVSSSGSSSADSERPEESSRRRNEQQPSDPLSDFTAAFGELSSVEQRKKTPELDEESAAAESSGYQSARSSAHSSSISSSGDRDNKRQQQRKHQQKRRNRESPSPQDPLSDFTAAFGELSAIENQSKQTDVIDEASKSSAAPLSSNGSSHNDLPPSHSNTSSDDPLTQFTKVYSEYAEDPGVMSSQAPNSTDTGVVVVRAPEPPASPSQQTAASKLKAQQGKKKPTKKAGAGGPRRASMSTDRKRKIRELFPNYPDVSTGSHGSLDPVGVYLHQKCAAPLDKTLTPRDLRELLEVFPFAAYCAEDKGRLPLHTLGENSQLVQDQQGRQRATNLAKILIRAYPESVKYPDSNGMLPFVQLVRQWIELSYEAVAPVDQPKGGITASAAMPPRKTSFSRGSSLVVDSSDRNLSYEKLFPDTVLAPYVEWCLQMMSIVLDDMVGQGILKEAFAGKPLREQMDSRRLYVGIILGSLPYLIKSVLFLDGGDGPVRQRIAQMPFIRRALLSKESVGGWIQAMVIENGKPSKIAIDYFHLLSNTTPDDLVGHKRSPDDQDVEAFHKERERVYRAIEKMEMIIPS